MLLHRLSRSTLQTFLIGAAALGAVALMPAPEAKAACLPTNPSNTCSTFDPTTPSNISAAGGINQTLNSASDYVRARVGFQLVGTWATPVSLSGIQLAGAGISGTQTLGTGNLSVSGTGIVFTDYTADFAPIDFADLNNSRLTFVIPGLAASPGAVLRALIQYADADLLQVNTSNTFLSATAGNSSQVPGPLPLLGAGAAFGFSRKMRRRISRAS